MDEAYKQHHNRRKNRSSTNLNHLTLAPLTPKLPFGDDADFSYIPPVRSISYIQGKSAPTTPSILARPPTFPSSSRSSRRTSVADAQLPKSKSASHLGFTDREAPSNTTRRKAVSGAATPNRRARNDALPRDDSDWLLRAGILMSAEAREYKGQMWLTSRESSTSLVALRDDEAEADILERELARERELMSRYQSRRSSVVDITEGTNGGRRSTRGSRHGSRSASRVAPRGQGMATLDGRDLDDGYFDRDHTLGDEYDQGPDFVNPDDRLEVMGEDTSKDDEATVRKLVKAEGAGPSSWFGLSLFSVEENPEDSDTSVDDDAEGEVDERHGWRGTSTRHFEGVTNSPKEQIPPPDPDQGGWHDAAWLLSVACKVLL
ncbi:hypothetical protein ACRALDRAFT_1060558 [Sodiomyces alcalophilus JCM 7366]|uniref:uncharacterized protein n=1 Tax=Sodiomyces alcalophilus JCM 7366 TaxID=591952 RepID=UPI0039B48035